MIGKSQPEGAKLLESLAVGCITPILASFFALVARIFRARTENARA
jgi:hypothetical protein